MVAINQEHIELIENDLLVNLTAKRAREIADIAEANEVKLTEKPVTLALDDVINERIIPVCEEPQE